MAFYAGTTGLSGITTGLTGTALTWNPKIEIMGELKEAKNMEYFYEVYAISKQKELLIADKVVAKNEEDAKFSVGVYKELNQRGMKLSDVTVIVRNLGSVEVEKEDKE